MERREPVYRAPVIEELSVRQTYGESDQPTYLNFGENFPDLVLCRCVEHLERFNRFRLGQFESGTARVTFPTVHHPEDRV